MNPNEYQQLALRTESSKSLDRPNVRLLHAAMGCCTEAGELMDGLKRHFFYAKTLDEGNVVEEFGDLLWYIALGLDAVGATLEDAMARNIEKLRRRYPDKFTEEKALNRDLDAERKVFERE